VSPNVGSAIFISPYSPHLESTMKKLVLVLIGTLLPADVSGDEAALRFERVTGEQSGTAAALEAWHREEMTRQGGPGKSHGWWPWGLRAFDFDGDGVLDLLASHHGVPHSMLLRGGQAADGSVRFVDATKGLGVDYRDLPSADDRPWIWDFDGDGRLDVAGFSDESRPNSIWNRGEKTFEVVQGFTFAPLSHPREVIDLDGDGYLDLDGGNKGRWFYVPEQRTFRHDARPRFTMPAEVPSDLRASLEELQKSNRGFRAEALTHDVVNYDTLGYHPDPIDLDGDGLNDVVIAGSGGYGAPYRGKYLFRRPDGRLVDRTAESGLPENGAPIYIRDLTGDGLPEILIVADKAGESGGGLFLNEGRGSFRRVDEGITKFLDRRGPYLIRAHQADFNDDGLPDLVLANPRLGQTVGFRNQGRGRFSEDFRIANCWDNNSLVIADFDRDDRIDFAVGVRLGKDSHGDIHLFLNRTPSASHRLVVRARMPAPNPFAVGAIIEIYEAGTSSKPGVRPFFLEKAHPDGTPVHVGLGDRTACDVRVRFPDGSTIIKEHVPADRPLNVTP
jgi:hypothetical protein